MGMDVYTLGESECLGTLEQKSTKSCENVLIKDNNYKYHCVLLGYSPLILMAFRS